jgi:hypothetical protein
MGSIQSLQQKTESVVSHEDASSGLTVKVDELFSLFEAALIQSGGKIIEPITSRAMRNSPAQLPRVVFISLDQQGLSMVVEKSKDSSEGCVAKATIGTVKRTLAKLYLPAMRSAWIVPRKNSPQLDVLTHEAILLLIRRQIRPAKWPQD